MVRGVAHCPCCIVHFVHDRGEAAMCVSQDLGVVSSPRISIGPAGCRVNRHGYRAMTIPGSPLVWCPFCMHGYDPTLVNLYTCRERAMKSRTGTKI